MSNHNSAPNWLETIIRDNLSKLSPAYAIAVAFLLFLVGLTQPHKRLLDHKQTEKSVLSEQSTQPTQPTIYTQHNGRAEFERLKIGSTLATVEAILGRGNRISQSETTSTFLWENLDQSFITLVFENGKLKTKSQSKLK